MQHPLRSSQKLLLSHPALSNPIVLTEMALTELSSIIHSESKRDKMDCSKRHYFPLGRKHSWNSKLQVFYMRWEFSKQLIGYSAVNTSWNLNNKCALCTVTLNMCYILMSSILWIMQGPVTIEKLCYSKLNWAATTLLCNFSLFYFVELYHVHICIIRNCVCIYGC